MQDQVLKNKNGKQDKGHQMCLEKIKVSSWVVDLW